MREFLPFQFDKKWEAKENLRTVGGEGEEKNDGQITLPSLEEQNP